MESIDQPQELFAADLNAHKDDTFSGNGGGESEPYNSFLAAPIASSVNSSGYTCQKVKQLESKYYYACISRGDCGAFNGPKLIYRTSKDDWIPPTGPYTYHVMFRGITNSLGIRICGPKSVTGYVLST